jgi:hypothetical protein
MSESVEPELGNVIRLEDHRLDYGLELASLGVTPAVDAQGQEVGLVVLETLTPQERAAVESMTEVFVESIDTGKDPLQAVDAQLVGIEAERHKDLIALAFKAGLERRATGPHRTYTATERQLAELLHQINISEGDEKTSLVDRFRQRAAFVGMSEAKIDYLLHTAPQREQEIRDNVGK